MKPPLLLSNHEVHARYSPSATTYTHLIDDEDLDEDTETWPVPKEIVKVQVNGALKNVLVEIHFGIVHYKIGRAGETHDSFTAVLKQIIILQTAPVQTPSTYKRKNVRSGPVRPKGFEDFYKDTPDFKGKNVASGSRG